MFWNRFKNKYKVKIRRSYYESGALWLETPYVNGKEHGTEKWYYESGALDSETPYENGKKHGIEKSYYEDKNNIALLILYDKDQNYPVLNLTQREIKYVLE